MCPYCFAGDWITPHGSESDVTSPENLLFNNCYLRYITALASNISAVLGDTAAATKYSADADALAAGADHALSLVTHASPSPPPFRAPFPHVSFSSSPFFVRLAAAINTAFFNATSALYIGSQRDPNRPCLGSG